MAVVTSVPGPREPEHGVSIVLEAIQQLHVLGRVEPRGPVAFAIHILKKGRPGTQHLTGEVWAAVRPHLSLGTL